MKRTPKDVEINFVVPRYQHPEKRKPSNSQMTPSSSSTNHTTSIHQRSSAKSAHDPSTPRLEKRQKRNKEKSSRCANCPCHANRVTVKCMLIAQCTSDYTKKEKLRRLLMLMLKDTGKEQEGYVENMVMVQIYRKKGYDTWPKPRKLVKEGNEDEED
jgi:hypothetical protein